MTTFDPNKQHRRSIRLREYDYSLAGAYFITSCVHNRECILREIRDAQIELSRLGEIVARCWKELPQRFPNVELDEFIIMPNHVHGIIVLTENVSPASDRAGARPAPTNADDVGATLAVAHPDGVAPRKPRLGDIVGAFKSLCVTEWLKYIKQNNLNAVGKFWQRNYYEHIVRDERDLNRIREYIAFNPERWELDRENPRRVARLDAWTVDEERWFSKLV